MIILIDNPLFINVCYSTEKIEVPSKALNLYENSQPIYSATLFDPDKLPNLRIQIGSVTTFKTKGGVYGSIIDYKGYTFIVNSDYDINIDNHFLSIATFSEHVKIFISLVDSFNEVIKTNNLQQKGVYYVF